MPRTSREITTPLITLMLLPVLILGVAGCASTPKVPTASFAAADTAIKQAEEARVADYASAELRAAREKIAAARVLAEKAKNDKDEKSMKEAGRLAEAARSDAELATATAQKVRAETVNKEMQQNNETLQQELQRNNRN